jgi:hypothetical protein
MDMDSVEKQNALRLLSGLENGGRSSADLAVVAEDLDPVLVYVIVSFLRAVYPASNPAATSVLERVVQLTSRSPVVVRKHKEGGEDPIAQWFESEHGYHAFRDRGADMIELVVDKLES